ncbi:GNAT family N-acetyltransferase [Paenibacillus sp. TAB 01]|uniref:GNAT family N-acetyltransferase n=1 Tax=Paenibacillus sp. TAB 01 TaxID=3368988 RepID=UPI003751301F
MLHHIQVEAFQDDLAQYQDYATNPACETIDKTLNRITSYDYYTIRLDDQIIGGICTRETAEQEYKISPFFISAKFQNQGFGSKIINLLLAQYPNACL